MNLLVMGGFFLADALRALGHRVVQGENFLPPGALELDAAAVLEQLPAADRPDLILAVERLGPRRLPLNLENVKVPRAFYALDPHLNLYWQQKYASSFDLVFTTQRSSMSAFRGGGRAVHWLPWAADLQAVFNHRLPRAYDIAFVGRLDPGLRRKRQLILEALQERFPVLIRGDRPDNRVDRREMGRIYSQARMVVNESIRGEVNLRVFETMAAGALLLTENVGPNLAGLFTPGEHLVTFGPEDLLEKAAYYLAREEERRAIAQRGEEEVRDRHDTLARARQFLEYLGEGEAVRQSPDHLQLGEALLHLTFRGLYPTLLGLSRARFHLGEALGQHPGAAKVHLALGQLALIRRNLPEARAAYGRALALEPGNFHLHVLQGHLLQEFKEPEAAAAAYRQGLKHVREVPYQVKRALRALLPQGMNTAHFFTVLGQVYESQGLALEPGYPPAPEPCFFSYAVEYYSHALELAPQHIPALKSLGLLLSNHGFPCEAASYYERWVEAEPGNPEARWLLGQAQLKGYQAREGLQNLLLAQALDPQRNLLDAAGEASLSPALLKTLLPQITPEEIWP